jgi:hypothetical protein
MYYPAPRQTPALPAFFFLKPPAGSTSNEAANEQRHSDDRLFIGMLDAYRRSGGLARLQELVALGRSGTEGNIAMLARCIAEREVICFEWQSHAWLPMFQFNRSDLSPYPTCRKIIAELSCIYDPWTLALWFSQPNARLANQAPADALFADFSTVLQVARADHQASPS